MQGLIGSIYGVRLVGSYGIKAGYFMFLKKDEVVINKDDAEALENMPPEHHSEFLGSLKNILTEKRMDSDK